MKHLPDIFKFMGLLHKFQQVKRRLFVTGEDRRENDIEHSYQLAMLAWYIIEAKNLKLDTNLALSYALVHDLVEVYAGDTYFYASKRNINSKQRREAVAAEKLEKEFPEFKTLHELIKRYEEREDEESKFVYALDKILPVLNIYMDDGRSWKVDEVTLDMLYSAKMKKVNVSLECKEYFDELMEKISIRQKKLF